MSMRFKQPDFLKKWTKYAAGVWAVIVLTTLASLGFDVREAHAQPNIKVKKVLERDINGGATSIVTNGDIYVYSAELGRSYISEDGLHWAQSDSEIRVGDESETISAFGTKLIWDGKQFITFQSDVLATSTDGVNWSGTRFESEKLGDRKDIFRTIFRDSEKYIAVTADTPYNS